MKYLMIQVKIYLVVLNQVQRKKQRKRVAIKIIKKKKAKQSDIEIVRTEIDVMKLCHHPNVVHLKQKYKVEQKRKSVYESNWERNRIVEVDV